nr:hypothetical protein [Rhizobium leguminosarum]
MALSAGAASAQNWTGTTSSDWTDGSNWTGGVAPGAGATVNISTIGVPSQGPTVLGVTGPISVSVGAIQVGQGGPAHGVLTIQNGSTLTSTGSSRLASAAGTTGIVTVTGPGSQWNIPAGTFYIGFLGTGTLNIENGGKSQWEPIRCSAATPHLRAHSISPAAAHCRPYPCGAGPA